jgi:uncharacterized membrane-anchored protein YhcB (DUF1043 family)
MKAETKQFFKKVFIAGLIFGLMVFLMVFFVKGVRAEDAGADELNKARKQLKNNETLLERHFIKVPNDEWPSQVIFDTVQVCYQGTLRWVAMGNPNLMNTPPPYNVARVMTIHCFCVLDKLRTAYKLTVWTKMLSKDNPLAPIVAPKEFMQKAVLCIKDHNTLTGLVVLDPKMLDEFLNDNETSTRKQKESDNGSGTSDSIPEQPNEPLEEAPQINF